MGRDALQGCHFSRPLPAAGVPALLQQRWRLDETGSVGS